MSGFGILGLLSFKGLSSLNRLDTVDGRRKGVERMIHLITNGIRLEMQCITKITNHIKTNAAGRTFRSLCVCNSY